VRILANGTWMTIVWLARGRTWVVLMIVQPIVFSILAHYFFIAGHRPVSLLYASLGAGLMGVWTSAIRASGTTIEHWRLVGTLEAKLISPAPLWLIVLPTPLGQVATGVYSLCATLLWGRLVFGVPLEITHPAYLVLAIPAMFVALALLGVIFAATFVFYPSAGALTPVLEYPVWLISGVLIPTSLLPGWTTPIAWTLAPTWGNRAIRESVLGGDPVPAIAMTVLLSVAYFVLGALLLRLFARIARERGTLALT
jgi:ABC-2 type transport system permease protein